jgi:hypothetical protein
MNLRVRFILPAERDYAVKPVSGILYTVYFVSTIFLVSEYVVLSGDEASSL